MDKTRGKFSKSVTDTRFIYRLIKTSRNSITTSKYNSVKKWAKGMNEQAFF